jgi:hypothetical protein
MLYVILTVSGLINQKLGGFCRFEEKNENNCFIYYTEKLINS